MSQYWIIAAILLPVIGGVSVYVLPFKNRKSMLWCTELIVIATSVITAALLFGGTRESFDVVYFVNDLSIAFKIDGMTMVFAGLIAVLWPLASLYAFEYMEHDNREKPFYMFYIATYGITLGIAFASNILTMYLFYELLTLVTIPLVMHTLTRQAIHAVRKYMYFSHSSGK